MCITRSNFVVHEFDLDILFYTVRGNIYMPNFEVPCTVVQPLKENQITKKKICVHFLVQPIVICSMYREYLRENRKGGLSKKNENKKIMFLPIPTTSGHVKIWFPGRKVRALGRGQTNRQTNMPRAVKRLKTCGIIFDNFNLYFVGCLICSV